MNLATTPRHRPRLRKMAKRSLASVLEEHGSLAVVDAVDIALDVCDALARPGARLPLDLDAVLLVWPAPPPMRRLELLPRSSPSPERPQDADAREAVVAIAELVFVLLVGAPPAIALASLSIAPKALALTVDACLARDTRAPRTLDELAAKIATFASSPAERFERLASRRMAAERARVRAGRRDMDLALDRLDRAAAIRQIDPGSVAVPRPVREAEVPPRVLARLIDAVDRSTGSEASAVTAPPSPLDAGASLQIPAASSSHRLREEVASVFEPRVAALSIPPLALAPVAPAPVAPPPAVLAASKGGDTRRVFGAVVFIAALVCVAVGVFVGTRIFRRSAVTLAVAVTTATATATATTANRAEPPAAAAPLPSAPSVRAVTPASLPDAVTTPAALPDARPVVRHAPPRLFKPRESIGPTVTKSTDDALPPEAPPYKSQE